MSGAALLDTLLPASEDGRMPSAATLDFPSYLERQAPDFEPRLAAILAQFEDDFAERPLAARVERLQDYARSEAAAFQALLLRVYDCYYQNAQVRELIGCRAAPLFPNSVDLPAGDFGSLAAVQARGKGYRR